MFEVFEDFQGLKGWHRVLRGTERFEDVAPLSSALPQTVYDETKCKPLRTVKRLPRSDWLPMTTELPMELNPLRWAASRGKSSTSYLVLS